MAQFTAQGYLKLLFNRDGAATSATEYKDPFQHKLLGCGYGVRGLTNSIRGYNSNQRFTTRLYSSSMHKSEHFNVEDSLNGVHDVEDYEYDSESETDDLACYRGLVLDIANRPVNVVCWRRAICLEFMEKADVLQYYDQTVNLPSGSFYIPAVLRVPHLLQVFKRRRIVHTLSRRSILVRDNYTCQYCLSQENLTIDHVLPIARGGEQKWENLVAACSKCNSRKGGKTLDETDMRLIKIPKAPKDYDILAIPLTSAAIKMLKLRNGIPEEWRQYLGESTSFR